MADFFSWLSIQTMPAFKLFKKKNKKERKKKENKVVIFEEVNIMRIKS